MKWSEIEQILGKARHGTYDENVEIQQLSLDSRTIQHPESTIFFAVKGNQHDGHSFIPALAGKGVRHFIVEKHEPHFPAEASYVIVKNSIKALQQLAAAHRKKFDIPILAVTGSNGKTTVKEWLSTVLQQQYHVVKSPKSYNSQIGVPLSVWQIDSQHDIGVFEAGISQSGEMGNLARVIQPTIGIFTSIGPAHDEGFTDRQEKIREKSQLFSSCKQVIYRKEYSAIHEQLPKEKAVSWSTVDSSAHYFFDEIGDQKWRVIFEGDQWEFTSPFVFDIWVENLFHVITAALLCRVNRESIQAAIEHLKPVKMRLELKTAMHQSYVIDDTYNNDLQALRVSLNFLRQQRQNAKRTLILSDILQSGMSPSQTYQQVNAWLKEEKINRLVAIGPDLGENLHLFDLPTKHYDSADHFLQRPIDFREEMILVKGARRFGLEKIVHYLEAKSHRTILEVNFEALLHNLSEYRKLISPGTRVMVMVKAFAYGGGSQEIANLLQYHNVDYLGVAYTDEAVSLRQNGIRLPIMVMNPDFSRPELLNQYDLEPEVYSMDTLDRLIDTGDEFGIHLKIETGMNRLGFVSEELPELIKRLRANPQIKVVAIFSHLAAADDLGESDFTRQQASKFMAAYEQISRALEISPLRHLVNSAGIVNWPDYHFEMVRLGIGLYGFDPAGSPAGSPAGRPTGDDQELDLRPISTLKTSVSQVKNLTKGDTVGYGRMGKADKDMKIAIVPIGYADGYLRVFSRGHGKMLIRDRLVPTIGNVCMDMTMLDVTELDVKVGDQVIVFGQKPRITDLARWSDTIPYEILTNISQRVKRTYSSE